MLAGDYRTCKACAQVLSCDRFSAGQLSKNADECVTCKTCVKFAVWLQFDSDDSDNSADLHLNVQANTPRSVGSVAVRMKDNIRRSAGNIDTRVVGKSTRTTSTRHTCRACARSLPSFRFSKARFPENAGAIKYKACVLNEVWGEKNNGSVDSSGADNVISSNCSSGSNSDVYTHGLMTCIACHTIRRHDEYSATQWELGKGVAKCKDCVLNGMSLQVDKDTEGVQCGNFLLMCSSFYMSLDGFQYYDLEERYKGRFARCKACVGATLGQRLGKDTHTYVCSVCNKNTTTQDTHVYREWQAASELANERLMYCSVCRSDKGPVDFSHHQWVLGINGAAKCLDCVRGTSRWGSTVPMVQTQDTSAGIVADTILPAEPCIRYRTANALNLAPVESQLSHAEMVASDLSHAEVGVISGGSSSQPPSSPDSSGQGIGNNSINGLQTSTVSICHPGPLVLDRSHADMSVNFGTACVQSTLADRVSKPVPDSTQAVAADNIGNSGVQKGATRVSHTQPGVSDKWRPELSVYAGALGVKRALDDYTGKPSTDSTRKFIEKDNGSSVVQSGVSVESFPSTSASKPQQASGSADHRKISSVVDITDDVGFRHIAVDSNKDESGDKEVFYTPAYAALQTPTINKQPDSVKISPVDGNDPRHAVMINGPALQPNVVKISQVNGNDPRHTAGMNEPVLSPRAEDMLEVLSVYQDALEGENDHDSSYIEEFGMGGKVFLGINMENRSINSAVEPTSARLVSHMETEAAPETHIIEIPDLQESGSKKKSQSLLFLPVLGALRRYIVSKSPTESHSNSSQYDNKVDSTPHTNAEEEIQSDQSHKYQIRKSTTNCLKVPTDSARWGASISPAAVLQSTHTAGGVHQKDHYKSSGSSSSSASTLTDSAELNLNTHIRRWAASVSSSKTELESSESQVDRDKRDCPGTNSTITISEQKRSEMKARSNTRHLDKFAIEVETLDNGVRQIHTGQTGGETSIVHRPTVERIPDHSSPHTSSNSPTSLSRVLDTQITDTSTRTARPTARRNQTSQTLGGSHSTVGVRQTSSDQRRTRSSGIGSNTNDPGNVPGALNGPYTVMASQTAQPMSSQIRKKPLPRTADTGENGDHSSGGIPNLPTVVDIPNTETFTQPTRRSRWRPTSEEVPSSVKYRYAKREQDVAHRSGLSSNPDDAESASGVLGTQITDISSRTTQRTIPQTTRRETGSGLPSSVSASQGTTYSRTRQAPIPHTPCIACGSTAEQAANPSGIALCAFCRAINEAGIHSPSQLRHRMNSIDEIRLVGSPPHRPRLTSRDVILLNRDTSYPSDSDRECAKCHVSVPDIELISSDECALCRFDTRSSTPLSRNLANEPMRNCQACDEALREFYYSDGHAECDLCRAIGPPGDYRIQSEAMERFEEEMMPSSGVLDPSAARALYDLISPPPRGYVRDKHLVLKRIPGDWSESSDVDTECAVCLEVILAASCQKPDEGGRKLVCGHVFHDLCVRNMLLLAPNDNCPVCRHSLK
ncbi:hypothetical protein SARC_09456 [Sphaeroforma arctica JP610]|uniref:RING-type domain-containing protein n=1 Tax=Sphaeroforma arctica JP610 TaxID=667725 RepID=A0A0L0FMW7_9EUKA|nr:hypothetical protein SARC_09456 [Sphaeroforma arctica JP610]KNC78105.1 hypothetical protein SARC_09456 [Sphaeroforma arctica JP610]|eukprot:XP_014152007.1 hypothetical protein SARC_09456 [Sphaeroforma arctica JP610]